MNTKKFLAIAFMCHQRPDRSFFIKGKQFPLCARCTGILAGYFIGIIIALVTRCTHSMWYLLCLLPMIADGSLQKWCAIPSNNTRRFLTGISGGVGVIYVFINLHLSAVAIAGSIIRLMELQ